MTTAIKTVPAPCLLAAIEFNYDNTEGIDRDVLLAYWTTLTDAADDDEPRRAFETLHAAVPFAASSSLRFDLSGHDVFQQTEALAFQFAQVAEQAIARQAESSAATKQAVESKHAKRPVLTYEEAINWVGTNTDVGWVNVAEAPPSAAAALVAAVYEHTLSEVIDDLADAAE